MILTGISSLDPNIDFPLNYSNHSVPEIISEKPATCFDGAAHICPGSLL